MPPTVEPSSIKPYHQFNPSSKWLRHFSKLTCLSTLFLIFAGAMVKSTDSGLAVPDWPLSYGMLFPPMVGGVFYEHGHRMVATLVGFFMLCFAIWLGLKEERKWVKTLGYCALGAVIIQGILGGITVIYFLPTPISVTHGILAQIFFVLTIILAYSQSKERRKREFERAAVNGKLLRITVGWIILVFIQLILGAVMRHTESGLAIPDFPTMGGQWIPLFNDAMLAHINDWRFDYNYDPVNRHQVVYHFLHRLGAVMILGMFYALNKAGYRYCMKQKRLRSTLIWINVFVIVQIALGIFTVWTEKSPLITSFHVMTGALLLGLSVLLLLRVAPLSLRLFKTNLKAS